MVQRRAALHDRGMLADARPEAVLSQHLAAMNRHDASAVAALYSDDGRWAEPPGTVELHGRDLVRQYLLLIFRAFPDLTISNLRSLASRNAIIIEWRAEGTHRGAFLGLPGTGRHVAVHGASILDIRDGKVLVSHHYCDSATLLRQLDALPQGEPL